MNATKEERTRIAADLLRVDRAKVRDVEREVKGLVRAMAPAERNALTGRINGVIDWVAAYEAQEILCHGKASV